MIATIATMAMTVACKKATPEGGSGPVGSGSAAVVSGSGSGAGSSGAGSGSAEAPSAGSGSAAPSNAGSGSAASAGSSARSSAGDSSGTGSGAGSAAGGSGPSGYDKVAFLKDPFCVKVADKIRECVDKPEFIAALDDGISRKKKRRNERRREAVKDWQTSKEMCTHVWGRTNYERGFVETPAPLKAPHALSSCKALGGAVKMAGGLIGGRTIE
jgi:hypothetical protein